MSLKLKRRTIIFVQKIVKIQIYSGQENTFFNKFSIIFCLFFFFLQSTLRYCTLSVWHVDFIDFNNFFYAGKVQYCVWFVMVITLDVHAMSRNKIDQAVKASLLKGENSLQQHKEELRQFRMNGKILVYILLYSVTQLSTYTYVQ